MTRGGGRHPSSSGVPTQQPPDVQLSMSWSGPIPPPGILQQYDYVVPNGAARIFKNMERNGKHRRFLEKGWLFQSMLGTLMAGVIALSGIGAGVYLLMNDKPLGGFASMLLGVGSVVTGFWAASKHQAENRKDPNQLDLLRDQ